MQRGVSIAARRMSGHSVRLQSRTGLIKTSYTSDAMHTAEGVTNLRVYSINIGLCSEQSLDDFSIATDRSRVDWF